MTWAPFEIEGFTWVLMGGLWRVGVELQYETHTGFQVSGPEITSMNRLQDVSAGLQVLERTSGLCCQDAVR